MGVIDDQRRFTPSGPVRAAVIEESDGPTLRVSNIHDHALTTTITCREVAAGLWWPYWPDGEPVGQIHHGGDLTSAVFHIRRRLWPAGK
ncbi:hypothetical protein GCM10027589_04510 [Actinocorallia lasiicapitis]